MSLDSEIEQQINKRFTLNLLIQGAAAHSYISASHLVKPELERIHPGLTSLYDKFAISAMLNYCIGDNALMFGRPNRWWGYSKRPQKPLRQHRLLSVYGNQLATQSTKHLKQLARKKNLTTRKVFHWFQFVRLVHSVLKLEYGHEFRLEKIAKEAANKVWGIPTDRLDGRLTHEVAFGNLQRPSTRLGRMMRSGAIGYGGVERREDTFFVVAKAWVFPILLHELIKGTMELICLHGLGNLSDDIYNAVILEADQLDYEAWLLQAGPEMWRKFIGVVPRQLSLAETMMNVARMDPEPLEGFMFDVIEEPNRATDELLRLND